MRRVGYTAGSTKGMEKGVRCSRMGNLGSENTRGYSYSSSDNSSVEPSKRCSTSLPCAARCVTFKLPICSMVATYTTYDHVYLANLDAETSFHVRFDSNSTPADDSCGCNTANGLLATHGPDQRCLQTLQTCMPSRGATEVNWAAEQHGHLTHSTACPARNAPFAASTHDSTVSPMPL